MPHGLVRRPSDPPPRPLLAERLVLWMPVVLAASGALLYSNSLDCAFHFDDMFHIVENEALQIESLSPSTVLAALQGSPFQARPLANLSFALNHYIGGLDVAGYHAVNITIHILTAIGFYVAVLLLLARPGLSETQRARRHVIAAVSALLWISHPVHVQAITYIVQRMAAMAALFVVWSLAAFLFALLRRGWIRVMGFGVSGLLFLCAMGSKETAVILPLGGLVGALVLSGRQITWVRALAYAGLACLIGLLALTVVWGVDRTVGSIGRIVTREPLYLLTLPRAFFYTLSVFLLPLPARLSFVHDLELSTSLLQPATTLPAFAGLIVVLALPVALARRHPMIAVALAWFLILSLLEPLAVRYKWIFEHRFYLSSMGLLLACGLLIDAALRSRLRLIATTGLLLVLCGLSAATYQRNLVWKTEITLWEDTVRKAPNRIIPYPSLILAWQKAGRPDRALAHHDTMMSLTPRDARDEYWMGVASITVDRHSDAVRLLERSIDRDPHFCESREALARAYAKLGEIERALQEIQPFDAFCEPQRGLRPVARRNAEWILATAAASMQARVARDPDDLEAHLILGGILLRRKQPQEARVHLEAVVRQDAMDPSAWTNLGFCDFDLGRFEDAESALRRAISLEPRLPNAHYGLGQALQELGRIDEALASFEQYVALAPATDPFRSAAAQRIRQLRQGFE